MVSLLNTTTRRPRTSSSPMALLFRNNLMQVLFLASFTFSLLHIGKGARSLYQIDSLFYSYTQSEETLPNALKRINVSKVVIVDDSPQTQPPAIHTASAQLANRKQPVEVPETTTTTAETTTTTTPDPTTWALVTPPGLLGGYRNQVIRLFGLVIGAAEQKVNHFLLPSILWSTLNSQNQMRWIPMEDLFDIHHWNSFSEELPQMVEELTGGDCWYSKVETMLEENQDLVNSILQRDDASLLERLISKPRFLKPIANVSLGYTTGELVINPRKYDLTKDVEKCTHPIAYGAGGGRGLLWVNYMEYNRKKRVQNQTTGQYQPDALERSFLQALRPHPKWRSLAQQCVRNATHTSTPQLYIALHPRIELEMMVHQCGTYMNKNLTRLLQDVQEFITVQQSNLELSGVFVALSRAGASVTEGRPYARFRGFIDENFQTMNRVLGNDTVPGQGLALQDGRPSLPVFECGDKLLQDYYRSHPDQPDWGTLLPSIVNFDVAVEAKVFIGFRFSSWSNSVWTTRYYLGRGDANYEYTRERGIVQMENGGLPPPHQNCEGIQDPGR